MPLSWHTSACTRICGRGWITSCNDATRQFVRLFTTADEREAAHEDAEVAPIIGAAHCGQNRAGVEEREIARVAVVHGEVLQPPDATLAAVSRVEREHAPGIDGAELRA